MREGPREMRRQRVAEQPAAECIKRMVEHVLHEQHGALGRCAVRQRVDVEAPVALQRRRKHAPQRAGKTRAEVPVPVGERRERRAAATARERDATRHEVRDGRDIDDPRAIHDLFDVARELQERQPRQQRAACAQQRAARDDPVGEPAGEAGGRVDEGVVVAHGRHCAGVVACAEEARSLAEPRAFAGRRRMVSLVQRNPATIHSGPGSRNCRRGTFSQRAILPPASRHSNGLRKSNVYSSRRRYGQYPRRLRDARARSMREGRHVLCQGKFVATLERRRGNRKLSAYAYRG